MIYYEIVPTLEQKGVEKMKKKGYQKLKGFFVENDIKLKEVAKLLNVSRAVFSKKINQNGGDFKLSEAKIICETYNLDANIYFLN